MNGTLYIVSTPIGNLADITLRALEVLKKVDLIAAEDTRHTKKLLNYYDIHTPLTSYFEHNELQKSEIIIKELTSGKNVALVSDSGTPTISDPGYRIVRRCVEAGINPTPIPGASAFLAAAVASAMPLNNFAFEGFLPQKEGKRRRRFQELKAEPRTLIFYESPHRLVKFLKAALDIFGDREAVIARELTKKFEEFFRGKLSEALSKYQSNQPRGEFTIIIEGERRKAEGG
jgi:16S rRNA (cytidine1402-2'-O)-methyltransferase